MARNNFINAEKVIQELTDAFKQHQKVINDSADALVKLDKEYSKLPSDYIKSQKELIALNTARSRSEKAVYEALNAKSRQEASAVRTSEVLRKATENQTKAYDREAQRLAASQNLYNKTQKQLNLVQAAYNNLATKKERYNNLTDQEERRLSTLGKVTERYNSTLKAVDATVGKHTRNVWNYAGSFNPLSNSINQLTREMPAFTNSVQTGFMALSNNIPIFSDAIGNAIRQNKELQAQGQPTTSVLKQVAGAFLSWQTLMGIGITLLTVYGKEIGIWVKELLKGAQALDAISDSQKQPLKIPKMPLPFLRLYQ